MRGRWHKDCTELWPRFWPLCSWNWMPASINARVRTFLNTVAVILTFRDRVNGLLLPEMGGYPDPPDKAPAGTKRLSRLLHCVKWSAELIRQYLWKRATPRLAQGKDAGLDPLAVWPGSWGEEPESIVPEEY